MTRAFAHFLYTLFSQLLLVLVLVRSRRTGSARCSLTNVSITLDMRRERSRGGSARCSCTHACGRSHAQRIKTEHPTIDCDEYGNCYAIGCLYRCNMRLQIEHHHTVQPRP